MVARADQTSGTKTRLIKAAMKAFAANGLEGATTKEIARLAGVNEVTLFRHFKTKDRLLSAVVDQSLAEEKVKSQSEVEAGHSGGTTVREILQFHAEAQQKLLMQNLPLIRTFIGEIHRHCTEEKTVTKALFLRHKKALAEDLEQGQRSGFVRRRVNLDIVADQFLGVLFSDVLRRSSPSAQVTYEWNEYLTASIDLFATGLEEITPPAKSRKARSR